ncbi:hypothetical protein H3221_011935 [Pseudomonas sp. LMG 31766]|uniref:Uncharacterized protein n=1 Tax=Pseudomonas chaetocerotis TaxID=2758695 RepID=A0A931GGQ6_9PSED|nr:hypothetical protein [Pseudomonas chaetocerotis]MBZ9665459.1 hypothetical protein [Pseudomonas chaetocerotis]
MTDKPQLMTEEIELIPHPMDAWRAALNALIACAPGDSAAIAVHLAEARQQALVFVDRTPATEGTRKLVDRLMLIGAGRIVGDRLQVQAAPATVADILEAATRANGKRLLTDREAEIISQDLLAGVRQHRVEPQSSSPATVAAINRRVTARLTVVVNGTDYDVSGMPGVMVGDVVRVDPNNMPPLATGNVIGLGFQGRLDPFAPIQPPSPASPGTPAQLADARPIETSVDPASAPLYPAPAVPSGEPVVPMHTSSQPDAPAAHQCSDDPA